MIIPSDIGICFPFFDGRPLFLSVIPASLEYDDAIQTERDRDAEEIRKILVQKIPHLQDGRLLFEPDEAAEMHADGSLTFDQLLNSDKALSVIIAIFVSVAIAFFTSDKQLIPSPTTCMLADVSRKDVK